MSDDYFEDFFSGHGGAREGAGRKPRGYVSPPEKVDFEKARGRNEAAKADLNELEFKIKSREYLARDAYKQASATAVASFVQTMRGVSDLLENQGVPVDVCIKVSDTIDNALNELADELEQFVGPEPQSV